MSPDPSSEIQLASVQQHLREDEESSSESIVHAFSTSSNQGGNNRVNLPDQSRRYATPPRLERKTRSRVGNYLISHSWSDCIAIESDSPLLEEEDTFQDYQDEITFSLSTDSSVDSDEQLERRALEIRNELRDAELAEIAHVAERAAAAGHETFAGQASTFIGDEEIEEKPNKDLQPVPFKRNITYTEGFRGSGRRKDLRRPLLRRSQTGGERKIPVMALRHIDDLIPPMKQLHQHLRAHMYRSGVDTENSTFKGPIEGTTESDLNDNYAETEARSDVSSEVSFIAKVAQWVTKPKTSPLMTERKDLTSYKEQNSDYIDIDPEVAFENFDNLSGHITSAAIAKGKWKRKLIKKPEGYPSQPDKVYLPQFTTPQRKSSLSNLWKKFGETTVETVMSSSISSENLEADRDQFNPIPLDKNYLEPDIIPVSLFDSDEEEDAADDEQPEENALGSRNHPKPFTIELQKQHEPHSPHSERKCRSLPKDMPNLFMTPVRLKGIRNTQKNDSLGRSNIAWGFSRADSFLSEFGTTPPRGDNEIAQKDEIVDDMKPLKDNFAKLDNNSNGIGDDGGNTVDFLKPRRQNIDKLVDMFEGNRIDKAQPMERNTAETLSNLTESSRNIFQEMTSMESDSENKDIKLQPSSTNSIPYRKPEESDKIRRRLSSADELISSKQRDASIATPLRQGCECLHLSALIVGDMQSINALDCRRSVKDLNAAPLRRVTSCPSFAEGCHDAAGYDARGKKSLLHVFERLSPLSKRKPVYFTSKSAKESHDYLSNYLYFSRPPTEKTKKIGFELKGMKPFCADPCEMRGCGRTLPNTCEAFSAVSDTACVFFKTSEDESMDLIDLDTKNVYAGFETKSKKSWFDAASARFDGAIGRFVASSRHHRHSRWEESFQAPTLTIKTPQHSHRKIDSRSLEEKDSEGRDSNADFLQDEKHPLHDTGITADPFETVYGISRNDFRSLSKDRRLELWQENQHLTPIRGSSSGDWSKNRKPSRRHRSTVSTSDIGEIWMEQAKIYEQERKRQSQSGRINL